MQTFLLYGLAMIGLVVVAMIAVILIVAVFESIRRNVETAKEDVRAAAKARHQCDLYYASWWFSEDLPTMRLLQALSRGESVDTVREQWRAEREGDARSKNRSQP